MTQDVFSLAESWTGPYGGVPPWDRVTPDQFPAAFAAAIADERAEIEALAANPDPPTFDNTLVALERAGRGRERVTRLFDVLVENVSTPEIQALDLEWRPLLSAADDAVVFWPGVFGRIAAVHEALGTVELPAEARRLTELTYQRFLRAGAGLDRDRQARLTEINQQLAALHSEFRSRILAEEDRWTVIDRTEDLSGLPASLIAAAGAAAEARGLGGCWIILNTRSSVDPVLASADSRALRERVWRLFKNRGDNGDANDTKATIAAIVAKRAERAHLLGFASHAAWRLPEMMARTPRAARDLLMRVWPAAVAQVGRDVQDMQAVAASLGQTAPIEPWDYLYYAEKVRQARYDLDHAALEPYFELDRMVAAAFWSAEVRFGLRFQEVTGTVPVFHPDVRVFEVTDADSGRHQGLIYLDNFARPGKRSGAWASSMRGQHHLDGGQTAIVSNNNNFVQAGPGQPTLLSIDDAETLFHEFGHALHDLLQDVTYPSLAHTPADFVELPSQVNERWLLTPELLDRFARHHETGERLSGEMVERIARAATFNQGYLTVEAVSAALVDLDLHERADGQCDPSAFEREALARLGMPREIALRHRLPHFDHLFGGDYYAAGYYSYLWADVMAADTWQAFLEAGGPWDAEMNARFRRHLLSTGNETDRGDAYRGFRGRDPDVQALLQRRGLEAP